MAKYLVGIDIGTSGTKSILMDTGGKLIASSLKTYDVLTPRALWAEQWPQVWLEACNASIRELVKKSGCNAGDIAGLAVSGLYGGSGIPLDGDMKPLRPCLIWMDRRAGAQEKWVLEHIGIDRIRKITHNGTDPYYGYTKILWIKDNEPDNWKKTKLFLPPNAYVIYQWTGEIAVDYSSAGNIGGIFDMNTRTWSAELLAEMGIPLSMMPQRIVESSDIVGHLTKAVAEDLGLKEGTPVCAGGVDCVVATLGLGVFKPGTYATAIGTSMCAALIHDKPIPAQGLIEMPYVKDAKTLSYSFGGAATAGALIKWFRDNFGQPERIAEQNGGPDAYRALDKLATGIGPGSEGLILLPYFMGERSPIWDTNARGTLVGLSLTHTRGHIYRAFLEGVAYSLRDSMESTNTDIGESILVAGGAAKSPLWRQIIADVTGHSILCPKDDVEANLGDVILAGVGTGCFSYEDVQNWQVFDEPVRPNGEAQKIYDRLFMVYKSIYGNLKGDFAELSKL
ncbi:sugar kinase, fggy family [Treponema primitia ZAS-2]|uniref:Sugar kinase, fggy family n=1 Tax=Treponema primitia (strain ATCC BAA-887 / DSM 12427 / ZAS-2) TaxID=545694 RepID=F5YK31_TREPZ|nr:FGGY-family carbohydrate kinase [Treponema primitia]AEF84822.1 sugar kinase, fggy family [Treponema primitia ZAS-2]